MRGRRRAFTLIELLVGIGVVAVLLGLLAPSLGAARSAARQTACVAMQKQLVTAASLHMNDNRGHIPGVNTTGRDFLFDPDLRRDGMLFNQDPSTPTTVFDWISPALGESMGLSRNRAERTWQIFSQLSCAEAREWNTTIYGAGRAPDANDFWNILETKGFPQISYLSPGPFHLLGPSQEHLGQGKRFGWRGPVLPPPTYKPRLERVGPPSRKIFLADGTRYVAARGVLDFDIDPNPKYYSSFTESTPIYYASTAYGRKTESAEHSDERATARSVYPINRDLSYRHRGRINVAYFDGHAGLMDERTSKTDAAPWHPTGSVFTGVRATEEASEFHTPDEELP